MSKSAIRRQTIYFKMIQHPVDGWMRVGKAYASREAAQSWLNFARLRWHRLPGKIKACRLLWIDGKLDAASIERLDKEFNMNPPDNQTNETS